MSREFARAFYSSEAWNQCRLAYRKSVGNLCEECLKKGLITPGAIVHHRTPLTPDNIGDPKLTLGWGNLELLCRDCHAEAHGKKKRRYVIGEAGNVFAAENIRG